MNGVWAIAVMAVVLGQAADDVKVGPREPALREEILRRKEVDQKARLAMIEAMNKPGAAGKPPMFDRKLLDELTAVDEGNTKWMKEVIEKHGWPGKSLVGDDGASAAWLMVQHADRDRAFQKKCLALMEAMPAGEVRGENIAYLQDRVLVGEGKKQRYGTQTTEVDGKFTPSPIEDEEHVDERRKGLGMAPLAEYLKQVEAMYRPKKAGEGP
jgi:hypothetical protein